MVMRARVGLRVQTSRLPKAETDTPILPRPLSKEDDRPHDRRRTSRHAPASVTAMASWLPRGSSSEEHTPKTWMMSSLVFNRLLDKFPEISSLKYDNKLSRLEVMSALQKAHWYFLDHLSKELDLESVGEHAFWTSALYHLAMQGVDPFFRPSQYISEWEDWSKRCMVGGAALVRCVPDGHWEVLMVKCYKTHLAEYSSTWAGGKADPTDNTLWETCVREVLEEIGLDLTPDRHKVVAVIENRRVFNAVIPLEYNDERLSRLVKKDVEIHEIVWSPINLNIDAIKVPRKLQGRIVDDGQMRTKENPAELRMPADFQNSYRMLQDLYHRGVLQAPLSNVDAILNQDPKDWLASQRKR